MNIIIKNYKCMELSLFRSLICLLWVTSLVSRLLGNLDTLIQQRFWVAPKITIDNLCRPFHTIIFHFQFLKMSKRWTRRKIQKSAYLDNGSILKKQPPEVFYKKLFLKISQYLQENTCVGWSCRPEDLQLYWPATLVKTQPAFTCSKLTIETLEQSVKYVQS